MKCKDILYYNINNIITLINKIFVVLISTTVIYFYVLI